MNEVIPIPSQPTNPVKFPDPVDVMAEKAVAATAAAPVVPEPVPGKNIRSYLISVGLLAVLASGLVFAYDMYLDQTVRKQAAEELQQTTKIDTSQIVLPDELPPVTPSVLYGSLSNFKGTPFTHRAFSRQYSMTIPDGWQAITDGENQVRIEKYTIASGSGEVTVKPINLTEYQVPAKMTATDSATIVKFLTTVLPKDNSMVITDQQELAYTTAGFPMLERTLTSGEQITHEITVVISNLALRFTSQQDEDGTTAMKSLVSSVVMNETSNETTK